MNKYIYATKIMTNTFLSDLFDVIYMYTMFLFGYTGLYFVHIIINIHYITPIQNITNLTNLVYVLIQVMTIMWGCGVIMIPVIFGVVIMIFRLLHMHRNP